MEYAKCTERDRKQIHLLAFDEFHRLQADLVSAEHLRNNNRIWYLDIFTCEIHVLHNYNLKAEIQVPLRKNVEAQR